MSDPRRDLDPTHLPIWGRTANQPANPPLAEGRVGARRLAGPIPNGSPVPAPIPAPTPRRPEVAPGRGDVDWALVAELRARTSQRLAQQTAARANSGVALGKEVEQEMGRAIIVDLVDRAIAERVSQGVPPLPEEGLDRLRAAVFHAVFEMGRIQPLLDDETVENITIVGDSVFTEHDNGLLVRQDPVSETDEELTDFIAHVAAHADNPRPFSAGSPSLHLRLHDGSRLAATGWVTPRPIVVIRRHRLSRDTLEDLVKKDMLSTAAMSFLSAAVQARLSIVTTGQMGAGKTTLTRALCGCIPAHEWIGTFETEFELGLHEMPDRHWIVFPWESRPGSGERGLDGRAAGEVSLSDCLWDSFRYNLSRQIVGEVRGPEAWVMIKAMESGQGSLSTTHATNARAALRKLTTCAMEAGPAVTHDLAVAKLAETIDLVVHCEMVTEPAEEPGQWRRHRWVSEILAVTPGEWPTGYATTSVFSTPPGERAARANIWPDHLSFLEGHGFDRAAFTAEASERTR